MKRKSAPKCTSVWRIILFTLSLLIFLCIFSFLHPDVACISLFLNIIDLLKRKYTFQIYGVGSANYKLGMLVQSFLVVLIGVFGAIHEIIEIFKRSTMIYITNNMGRSIVHFLTALLIPGFKGILGIISCLIEILFSLVCYIAATVESWNPIDEESE